VPIGAALVPLAAVMLSESHGPTQRLDLGGLALGSAGLLGLVYGLVRSQSLGWGSVQVVATLAAGVLLLTAFVVYESRKPTPMLPMSFFSDRSFSVANGVSLAMYFGMFGSIFFLSQFLQNVLHNSPLQAGVKLLVWTGATMVVAPLAGYFSQHLGSRWFMAGGLALQALALAWLAALAGVHMSYASMIAPFVLAGSGMALVFAPVAAAVLAAVAPDQAGQASGANNTIRELGGVLGIAVLATVFTSHGGYASAQSFVNGLVPAMWIGVAVLGAGALVAGALAPGRQRTAAPPRAIAELSGAVA
jgi:predicted MFS family arabinose efflux permease